MLRTNNRKCHDLSVHSRCCLSAVFAALTRLVPGQYCTLAQHHVLPPNLLELSARNATSAECLLPLQRLRDLSLDNIEWDAAPAAELQQLSSLTALTGITLNYARIGAADAAAAGWGALHITNLYLSVDPGFQGRFARATLQHFSSLTALQRLNI
jgi:hypothetical protein